MRHNLPVFPIGGNCWNLSNISSYYVVALAVAKVEAQVLERIAPNFAIFLMVFFFSFTFEKDVGVVKIDIIRV